MFFPEGHAAFNLEYSVIPEPSPHCWRYSSSGNNVELGIHPAGLESRCKFASSICFCASFNSRSPTSFISMLILVAGELPTLTMSRRTPSLTSSSSSQARISRGSTARTLTFSQALLAPTNAFCAILFASLPASAAILVASQVRHRRKMPNMLNAVPIAAMTPITRVHRAICCCARRSCALIVFVEVPANSEEFVRSNRPVV